MLRLPPGVGRFDANNAKFYQKPLMTMRRHVFAMLAGLIGALLAPQTQANPYEHKLTNGLSVIVKEDRRGRPPCIWCGIAPDRWTKRTEPPVSRMSSST